MEPTRGSAATPRRAYRRERFNRIVRQTVRETESPTDRFPKLIPPGTAEPDGIDNAWVGEVLDLAGSIGAILMASGLPVVASSNRIVDIAAAYGIDRCEADIINTTVHVSVYRGPHVPPVSSLHVVETRALDFSRLAAVDRLIDTIVAGELPAATARRQLTEIIRAPHPYKRWVATLAWGALAFATAGSHGGDLVTCLISAISAMAVDRTNRLLNRHGLPFFFQYAVGGAIATAPSMVLYSLSARLGLNFEPTVAIAAGLVVLLAGMSLVGSVGDLITGATVTGSARFFELVMMTSATIAGVALVLHMADHFGAPGVAIGAYAPPALTEIPARIAFGAASAAACALAYYSERSALMAAAFGGAAGVTVSLLTQRGAGLGAVGASFMAAAVIGLVGRLMEHRNLAPPMVVSMAGITPLLPGLALLHGIYAILNNEQAVGFASVLGALAIGTALAAGVSLGEWGSWKMRRRKPRDRRQAT